MIISLERKKVEAKNEKEGWLPEITRGKQRFVERQGARGESCARLIMGLSKTAHTHKLTKRICNCTINLLH